MGTWYDNLRRSEGGREFRKRMSVLVKASASRGKREHLGETFQLLIRELSEFKSLHQRNPERHAKDQDECRLAKKVYNALRGHKSLEPEHLAELRSLLEQRVSDSARELLHSQQHLAEAVSQAQQEPDRFSSDEEEREAEQPAASSSLSLIHI